MSSLSTYSKLIALATALFLLSANLDNIPDSPECLNSNAGSSTSVQLAHAPLPGCVEAFDMVRQLFRPPQIKSQFAVDSSVAIPPCCTTRSVYRAADPSPPVA